MLVKEKVTEFWRERTKIKDPRLATHFKHDDALDYDVKFILNHIGENFHVLDLGCGTGAIVNSLEPYVAKIMAVDSSEHFLKFCIDSPKIVKKVVDLPYYEDDDQYDVILLFGILNFLNNDEVIQLYKICQKLLKEKGMLLIKHACAVHEDLLIDNYSEVLGQDYHALYRSLANDQQLISKIFSSHVVVDIYPKHLNPWSNTHFYAFVVEK